MQFIQPSQVFELGSGQTTKLLSCYAEKSPSAYILTLEQDYDWVQRIKNQVTHNYMHSPLCQKVFTCKGTGSPITPQWYKYMPNKRFNFIIVDGPDNYTLGTDHTDFSRSGVLEHIPSILAEQFIVVFDDAERYGEIMTTKLLSKILDAHNIRFIRFAIHGTKTQIIFCSPELSFLRSI